MSLYETYREYARIYEKMELTENGPYKEGEAPVDSESILTVEVTHHVTLVDEGGKLLTLWFYVPEAKDKDDLYGGGYTLNWTDAYGNSGSSDLTQHHWFLDPGEFDPSVPAVSRNPVSTVRSQLYLELNTGRLSYKLLKAAEEVSEAKRNDPRNPESPNYNPNDM